MRKVKRLRAEKVIAIMVVASVCKLLAIPIIGYMFARPPIATGSTPAEVAQNKADIDTAYTAAVFVIKALGVVGIAGIVVSLASGLVIAFGIGPSWRDLTPELIAAAHRHGLIVHPYTVNEEADMERLIGLGVDGIFTNYPDRLVGALSRAAR